MTVIQSALVVVAQHVIGFADFLELGLGVLVPLIAVGVILHRKLAIGLLQRIAVGVPLHR